MTKFNHRLIYCLLITALSLLATFFVFSSAFGTLRASAAELWQSAVVYFVFLFTLQLPTESPIQEPTGETANSVLPDTAAEFTAKTNSFWEQLFNGRNFAEYLQSTNSLFVTILRILPFVVMLIFALRILIKRALSQQNNDYGKDTKPLRIYKKISSAVYMPAKNYLASCFDYIKATPFPKLLLLIWLFNFNIFAVLLSVIAIAFYFFVSFDFVSIYNFVHEAITKLQPAFGIMPLWAWILLALWAIDHWRKNIALAKLRHNENKNKGFILERSICTMLVGTMGKGKTTLITDISLSTEAIFRSKAQELLIETDLKFPHFPYITLENEIKQAIHNGIIFNLASAGEYITAKETEFNNTGQICGYDYKKYGLYFDDKKTMIYLFDALRDYAKLYLIYITQSSLIISNYAVRTDFLKADNGNFPKWNLDFFTRDSKRLKDISRHSHILDFDMLRLGKKLIDNNKLSNAFEFGVIAITETGKERGNQDKNIEIKETISQLRNTIKDLEKVKADTTAHKNELIKLTDHATQLTDKFNDCLKLIRHKCTVCGFPFARVFLDEQRPESLGADARDLCEIVHIKNSTPIQLAMPFYFVGELLHDLIFPKFTSIYTEYRFNRGDTTLLMYLIKKVGSGLHRSYTRIYNRFGYSTRLLAIEDGMTGLPIKQTEYYLSTKKIYSDRFSTDAYYDIFANGLKTVNIGIDNIPEYVTHKASETELKSQNSYFIQDITKYGDLQKEESCG
jgi:hypothetical protein